LIDTSVVELLATIPADKKFPNGQMKYLLKSVFSDNIPSEIANRKDKMGFPVPLQHWFGNELHSFLHDTFSDIKYKHRDIFNLDEFKDFKFNEMQFSRKTWALLALELWHQNFHDKFHEFQSKLKRINV
jgi:asparagine synthase (glutamine-hydrolysing)